VREDAVLLDVEEVREVDALLYFDGRLEAVHVGVEEQILFDVEQAGGDVQVVEEEVDLCQRAVPSDGSSARRSAGRSSILGE
jgi:hypothetical protein